MFYSYIITSLIKFILLAFWCNEHQYNVIINFILQNTNAIQSHLHLLKMSVSKQHVVRLYRNILKTSKLFPYTYREYTIRRTRDKFKELKVESDPAKFEQGIKDSEKLLEIIQRQSIINGMYNKRNLVVEVS